MSAVSRMGMFSSLDKRLTISAGTPRLIALIRSSELSLKNARGTESCRSAPEGSASAKAFHMSCDLPVMALLRSKVAVSMAALLQMRLMCVSFESLPLSVARCKSTLLWQNNLHIAGMGVIVLIKNIDERSNDIGVLDALLQRTDISSKTRGQIARELNFIKAGVRGERETAYELKSYETSANWAVIHDVRFEYEGAVAQIDHILINRLLEFYVLESKHFSEGVAINDHGEFTMFFGGKPIGIPSPIEQNKRHISVLKKIIREKVALPSRIGVELRPSFYGYVVVSKRARIGRPRCKIDGVDSVVKADQIASILEAGVNDDSLLGGVFKLSKLVSSETLKELAANVASLHKPKDYDWEAKFSINEKSSNFPLENGGISTEDAAVNSGESKRRLICFACEKKVSFTVAKFCWNHSAKFGGNAYCMDCQKLV